MSQGPLCPNLSQKVQKEVSQMANQFAMRDAIRWFKCKLKPPKKEVFLANCENIRWNHAMAGIFMF